MAEVASWQRQNMKKGGATGVHSMHSKIAKPTVKHYADGGEVNKNPFQGDDVDPFSAVRGEDGGIDRSKMTDTAPAEPKSESKPAAPAARMSFKDAFRAAKDGSTFEWNGKKFKKEYAQASAPRSAAKKAPAKSADSGPAPKMSLAQRKGNEFAAMENAARRAESDKNTSPAARKAVRAAADNARKTYQAAADAEKSGRSVVFRR